MASRFQGVHKQSTGYKMLAALGWKEGEGLGAMKQGITEHVRVKKVHEKTGVGAAEAAVKARDWTLGMVAYDRVLAALNEVTSHHAARHAESDSDDAEERVVSAAEEAAAKAAAKAVRAARKAAKAAAKVNAEFGAAALPAVSDSNLTADGSVVSSEKKRKRAAEHATAAVTAPQQEAGQQDAAPMAAMQQPTAPPDAALEAEPEVKRVRHARHTGRFKRREAGKRVRHYSADDLTAILGGRPQGGGASHSDKGGLQEATERAASPETPSASEPPKPTSSDSPRPEGACGEVEAVSSAPQDPAERRWWHGYFVRAGRLAGLKQLTPPATKSDGNGFKEDDQVAAWTAAQDGATKSKQGLGRSGQPRKVGGARWQGTRTKLDSDDEATPSEDAQSEDGEDEQQVVVRAPKGAAATVVAAAATVRAAKPQPSSSADSIKWKKIARKVLQGQPGGAMKLRQLQMLAVAAAKLPAGVDQLDAAASLEARLRNSTMFVFQGKKVFLAKR